MPDAMRSQLSQKTEVFEIPLSAYQEESSTFKVEY